MQISFVSRVLNNLEGVRGWGKLASFLDKAYVMYFRQLDSPGATRLRKKFSVHSGKIIIVCKGNVCRSAFLAEYLKKITHPPLPHAFSSAGFRARDGILSPQQAVACALTYGIDLSSHRGSLLVRTEVEAADLIIGMEPLHHLEFLLRFYKHRKKFLLLRSLEPRPASLTVPDPLYGKIGFQQCFELLVHDGSLLVSAFRQIQAEREHD